MTEYAELQVTTNYSFLRGASHPEELIAQAKLLGLPAIGITDRNSLAGIVSAAPTVQSASPVSGGGAMASCGPCATTSPSRMKTVIAFGCSGAATAKTRRPAICNGSCTGFSEVADERSTVPAPGHTGRD